MWVSVCQVVRDSIQARHWSVCVHCHLVVERLSLLLLNPVLLSSVCLSNYKSLIRDYSDLMESEVKVQFKGYEVIRGHTLPSCYNGSHAREHYVQLKWPKMSCANETVSRDKHVCHWGKARTFQDFHRSNPIVYFNIYTCYQMTDFKYHIEKVGGLFFMAILTPFSIKNMFRIVVSIFITSNYRGFFLCTRMSL